MTKGYLIGTGLLVLVAALALLLGWTWVAVTAIVVTVVFNGWYYLDDLIGLTQRVRR